MKNFTSLLIFFCTTLFLFSCSRAPQEDFDENAAEYAQEFIIVDGHIDLPYRLMSSSEEIDIGSGDTEGDFDYEKAKEGGLNAPFMSIYIPARYQQTGGAMQVADSLINLVQDLATQHPDKFAIATSPEEIREQFKKELISLPMGLENGAPIENDLKNVQVLYDKGIRYITLAHSKDNQISDSSYDTTEDTHNGLSSFGEQVVKEMNRVGIMVDISHVTDSAFFDVMNVTEAPVIASHSSARRFTEGFERNMSDSMITRLAENNGVIMINFGSDFISNASRLSGDSLDAQIDRHLEENNLQRSDPKAQEYIEKTEANYRFATVSEVADHFDHVINLIGIEHVGFGSDFDGVGDTLPEGLKTAAAYPNLIEELLRRGYTKDDIRKICYENIFRVWREVQETAQTLSEKQTNQNETGE